MFKLKEDRNKIIIVGISGALFIIFQFYLLDYWEQQKLVEYAEIFQKGFDFGLEQAVFTIFNNTENCYITTIWVGNSSKQISDFSCSNDEMRNSFP